MKVGYTYIMGSPTGTLYIGVTSNIYERVLQHKDGVFAGFSKRYNWNRLLYYERQKSPACAKPPNSATQSKTSAPRSSCLVKMLSRDMRETSRVRNQSAWEGLCPGTIQRI